MMQLTLISLNNFFKLDFSFLGSLSPARLGFRALQLISQLKTSLSFFKSCPCLKLILNFMKGGCCKKMRFRRRIRRLRRRRAIRRRLRRMAQRIGYRM